MGSVFRTASAFGAKEVILCGISPGPPRPDLAKVSLGAEEKTPWRYVQDPVKAMAAFKAAGRPLALFDTGEVSRPLPRQGMKGDAVLVFGSERGGLPEGLARRFGPPYRIPHPGPKDSLNVSVAAGIAAWWALDPEPESP